MIVHHDKPIGVDAFFREIFAGDTVRRYAAPAKDDDYCSRSELLRAVAEAEKIAHGMK